MYTSRCLHSAFPDSTTGHQHLKQHLTTTWYPHSTFCHPSFLLLSPTSGNDSSTPNLMKSTFYKPQIRERSCDVVFVCLACFTSQGDFLLHLCHKWQHIIALRLTSILLCTESSPSSSWHVEFKQDLIFSADAFGDPCMLSTLGTLVWTLWCATSSLATYHLMDTFPFLGYYD